MSFNYEYYYVPHGQTKEIHGKCGNEIWLDVGQNIAVGVFDHHNVNEGYVSTVDVITNRIDLLEETKRQLNEDEPVRFFMHSNPDVDCLFSCFYLQFFLDNGKDEFSEKLVHSDAGKRIISYVNDIDSGKGKNVESLTLYNLICHLDSDEVKTQWNMKDDNELSYQIIVKGLDWVKQTYDILTINPAFDIYTEPIPVSEEDQIASIIKEIIKSEKDNYERDKREGRLIIKNIPIWTKSGELEEDVKAAIWNDVPLSPVSAYIFARNEGAVITFVPHHEYGNNGARVSINPDIEGAVDKYSLVEVAEMYEQLEQIYEKELFEKTGSLRRDYSRPRGDDRSPYFYEKPFSVTVEPWYVSDKGDMVDAPGKQGSLIPIEVMIDVLENITKMIKRTVTVEFDLKSEKLLNPIEIAENENRKNPISIPAWSKNIRKYLVDVNEQIYPLVICEVDAALISHNYNILDAYYMSLSDRAYVDVEGKTVFRLNYRTHLYVNQANAVLFIATSNVTANQKQMDGLLDWSNNETMLNSKLIEVFSKVLYQREKFKTIGKFLETFKEKEKDIKKQNEQLICLLAKAQADECIDSQVELDVFKFVYGALDISELKESVKDTMGMVSEYSKERVYANLNLLSMITIPFILFSTLLQIGTIKLAPLFDWSVGNSSISAVAQWTLFLVIVVIVTVIIFFGRKKR